MKQRKTTVWEDCRLIQITTGQDNQRFLRIPVVSKTGPRHLINEWNETVSLALVPYDLSSLDQESEVDVWDGKMQFGCQ